MWLVSSVSMTVTVPVNLIDMAPILTRISALTWSSDGLEHPAALDAGHDPLEIENRLPGLVNRVLNRERVVELNHGQRSFRRYVLQAGLKSGEDGDRGCRSHPGTYSLGPETASLRIRTGRSGAAAKAGHDLLIEVTDWSATIESATEDPGATQVVAQRRCALVAGARGHRRHKVARTTTTRTTSARRSTRRSSRARRSSSPPPAAREHGRRARGLGRAGADSRAAIPSSFALALRQRRRGQRHARMRQSDWGMKPYSALFGTLKVADELAIELEAPSLS